jgi:hypothetical protein
MDDLTAFLTARLDEEEAAANEVHRPRDCGSVDREGEFDPDPIWCSCDYPARVLREVAALRAILTEIESELADDPTQVMVQDRLHHLAAIWGGHPDYPQERKP